MMVSDAVAGGRGALQGRACGLRGAGPLPRLDAVDGAGLGEPAPGAGQAAQGRGRPIAQYNSITYYLLCIYIILLVLFCFFAVILFDWTS